MTDPSTGSGHRELVHYAVADNVATITLDSPHNRNALSRQLVTELFERLERAGADPAVKVVLVRQEGRVFCSGADLSEATTVGMADGARRIVDLQRLIVTMDKPVVVRVSGAVRAGGIGIVAAERRRDQCRRRDVRPHRGQARPRGRDHLPDRARPDEPARGGAHHARG